MKTFNIAGCLPFGLAFVLSLGVACGTESASSGTNPTTNTNSFVAPRLPYGVGDVLKLSQARVNEGVVVQYIQRSATIYPLTPEQIVYLKEQGVSDVVIKTMLEQRSSGGDQVAANPTDSGPTREAPSVNEVVYPSAAGTEQVQQPVQQAPRSTLHIIPYPGVREAYYGHYSFPHYNTIYSSGYLPAYGCPPAWFGGPYRRFHYRAP